jgi:hypothetical protein
MLPSTAPAVIFRSPVFRDDYYGNGSAQAFAGVDHPEKPPWVAWPDYIRQSLARECSCERPASCRAAGGGHDAA